MASRTSEITNDRKNPTGCVRKEYRCVWRAPGYDGPKARNVVGLQLETRSDWHVIVSSTCVRCSVKYYSSSKSRPSWVVVRICLTPRKYVSIKYGEEINRCMFTVCGTPRLSRLFRSMHHMSTFQGGRILIHSATNHAIRRGVERCAQKGDTSQR